MLLSLKTFYSLLGSSNIFLDKNIQGYFATNGFYNPFLHTWYLSVILQAYIIFALIAWVTRACSKKVQWGAYLTCGLASILFVCYYRFLLPTIKPHESLCRL